MHGDDGGDQPPSPSTSESSSYSHHHHHRNSRDAHKKYFFKLYVKFDIPMFNGECNAKKLNNWIRHIEIYYRIHLDSLWLSNTALIWWERKLQSSKNVGNLFYSWTKFISALKEQFNPLGYKQKTLMNWKYLRQGKG